MTKKFDQMYNSLIKEYTSAKSRRQKSRYWSPSSSQSSDVRQVRTMNNKTASQRTKLGNQQYVGKLFGSKGIRANNKSEKDLAQAGIAKGLGGHVRLKGVNPKSRGSKVNSKQGNMEIKYTLNNGMAKVGSTGKTQYDFSEPKHYKD